jgi:nuclear protein localization family protein 4
MFRSTKFPIENRPGLEDGTIQKVIAELGRLRAPELEPSTHSTADDAHRRLQLAQWFSDWHLLAFLGTTGLVSEVGETFMHRRYLS